jgi:hypothetical protein
MQYNTELTFHNHPLSYISTVCNLAGHGVGVNKPDTPFYLYTHEGSWRGVLTYKGMKWMFASREIKDLEKEAIKFMRELIKEDKEQQQDG